MARYEVHKLLLNKKKVCFENKLNDCISKSKELSKAIKYLGLPNKTSSGKVSALWMSKKVPLHAVSCGFGHIYWINP